MKRDIAESLVQAATKKSEEMGLKMCIAVVDDGALLTHFTRMDGAYKGSVDVAISKARTSALFPFSSGNFGNAIRKGELTGMEGSNGGLCAFKGGLPIILDGHQIGAIGVSGGTADQDEEVAYHALNQILES